MSMIILTFLVLALNNDAIVHQLNANFTRLKQTHIQIDLKIAQFVLTGSNTCCELSTMLSGHQLMSMGSHASYQTQRMQIQCVMMTRVLSAIQAIGKHVMAVVHGVWRIQVQYKWHVWHFFLFN
ncbi:Hsp67Bb [Drosophila busckii]|uniref:Hsp67Bb n=1 Tax=Drosophila busckii TaxID=30019 RepID=A0A0M4EL28_DROBS|nr:Hsp67Bb [Drosophila busckii]